MLLLALALLFLRLFPVLLRLGATLTQRGRGAVALLALAQMARAPRLAVRLLLLLTLAIAFALFTFVFAASQTQRLQSVAFYTVGADFSGDLPASVQPLSLARETALYQHISGMKAASAGYIDSGTSANISPGTKMCAKIGK